MAAARIYKAPQSTHSPGQQPPDLVKHKEHTSSPKSNCLKVNHLLSLKDEVQKNLKIYKRTCCQLNLPSYLQFCFTEFEEQHTKARVMRKDMITLKQKEKQSKGIPIICTE